MSADNGLFPPILQAYLPAFNVKTAINSGITIPYNISEFNSFSDITNVHVSITRQSDYTSLFDSTNYIKGIWIAVNTTDPSQFTENSITIPPSVFNKGNFAYNEYYKVQVRLSKDNQYRGEVKTALSEYLTNEAHLANFSEWSTVCAIKFIAPSTLKVVGNGAELQIFNPENPNNNTINNSNLTLSCKYIKEDIDDVTLPAEEPNESIRYGKNDNEYLSTYQIRLKSGNTAIFDSGILTTDINNPNSFVFTIPYQFSGDETDTLEVEYTTNDLYTETLIYGIKASYNSDGWNHQDDIAESLGIDTVIGKVNITFEPKGESYPTDNKPRLMVRRASDKDNFTRWDTIWTKAVPHGNAAIPYDDFTIESGVLYKYEINYIREEENEQHQIVDQTYTITEGPILSVFDNAFLTGEGTQLCVKFNPNLSNYRRNISDNVVTTIGSKYPYITRNGDMDYRSFTLSGTIAYEMDVEHQFSSRTSIYGNWINVYGSYFVNRFFNQQNDRVTQRKFRELVMNYLYDDKPKLFRSTPEGNILVRITDVSLTPNQQLSRMIYDFSCTVTEIGEANVENCKLYKIQDYGD